MKHLKFIRGTLAGALLLTATLPASAHTPLFDCFDNQDGTITCQAGFTDGASAEGIEVRVVAASGRVLANKKISAENRVEFERPDEEFTVVFDAGASHSITVFDYDIY